MFCAWDISSLDERFSRCLIKKLPWISCDHMYGFVHWIQHGQRNVMNSSADLPQKCKHAFIEFWKSYYMENVTVLQNTQIWLSCKNDSILQSIHTNGTDNGVSRYMNSSSWTCEYDFNYVFMIGNRSVITILGIAFHTHQIQIFIK